MTDPLNTPEGRAFARRALDELLPKMQGSGVIVSIVTNTETDVKFALELGFAIMLDKPIMAVVMPGVKVPDHLVRVADEIVSLTEPLSHPASQAQFNDAVTRMVGR